MNDVGQTSTTPIPSIASISPSDLKLLIAAVIREYQASLDLPILGYHKPYLAHYDRVPFLYHYIKPNFEEFDCINGSPHEHLAYFISACGELVELHALLTRQFMQPLKRTALTGYTQLPLSSIILRMTCGKHSSLNL